MDRVVCVPILIYLSRTTRKHEIKLDIGTQHYCHVLHKLCHAINPVIFTEHGIVNPILSRYNHRSDERGGERVNKSGYSNRSAFVIASLSHLPRSRGTCARADEVCERKQRPCRFSPVRDAQPARASVHALCPGAFRNSR